MRVAQHWRHIALTDPPAYRSIVLKFPAKVLILAFLCHATPCLVACGAAGTSTSSVVAATQRLGGSWRLQSFAPLVALDLPLQAVLSAEVGELMVTFNQGQFTVVGPGMNLSGRYVVTSAAGEQLSLVFYDQQQVAYHFTAQFMGNLLHFESNDKPWVGFGALERA